MTTTQQRTVFAGALVLGGLLGTRAFRARRRISFRGRTVVITGGSRGLGLLIARRLAAEGARLTLCARNENELVRAQEELSADFPDAEVRIETCDVSTPGAAELLVRSVTARTGHIDVLINNAGIIAVGPIDHMSVEDFSQAMAVHFYGPLHATLAALPSMRERGFGRVVNISSIGGKVAVPHLAPYCASKFALTGLSDALRAEVAADGIRVTTVCPGLMRTGSPFNAWFRGRHREEFAWFAIADSLPGASIDADRAAAQVVDACRHGDAELVISWPARLAVIANAVMPQLMAAAMSATNRLLPKSLTGAGVESHSGWQSLSPWAPSALTRLTERAAAANNEVPVPDRLEVPVPGTA